MCVQRCSCAVFLGFPLGMIRCNVDAASHCTSSCKVQEWLGELPEFIGEPSNHAEFVTSAERVRARPLSFWQNALKHMEVREPPADTWMISLHIVLRG